MENVKYVINVIRNETRMEYEYLIIGYIYLERMCKLTDYKFRICCRNWRYSLFSTLMLASKTWDDFALTNYHYSNIFCNLNLWRINKLEVELLLMLNFSIGVSSDEFHQYYDAIHQLITASNVRRIQNKLERYVIQTSATLNTTSSVSYSPTTSLHSPRYRDVPSLSLSPMSSDHYELSRVGGMCVLIEKESSYSSSRSKLESEREKASCDSGSLDGSGKVSFGPLISQHPKLLKGPAYSSKVLPMTSDQEYHPSSCSSTLRDLKHDSATTLLSVKLKPMPEPRKDHAESSEPYLKATLTGIKSFFIKLFSASDSNLSEEAKIDHQYPSERIQLARTFTHSEFSTSHRVLSGKSLSSRNSSWRTTRTKHLSEVQ